MVSISRLIEGLKSGKEKITTMVFEDALISEKEFYRLAVLDIQAAWAVKSNVDLSQAEKVELTPLKTIEQSEQEAMRVAVNQVVQKTLKRGEFGKFMQKNPTREEIQKWLEDNAI